MPIYEYECSKGHTFELMVPINGSDPKTCIEDGCRSKPRRVISASGFILKGSGWYTTDYPSEARKKGWEQEGKAANAGGKETPGTPSGGNGQGASSTPAPTPAKTDGAAPKPSTVEKASNKNPYSSSRGKSKGSKKSAT